MDKLFKDNEKSPTEILITKKRKIFKEARNLRHGENFLFEDENDEIRNHCHMTGKHLGAAQIHSNTIKKQNFSSVIPLALHDMNFYDSYNFLKELVNRKHLSVPFELNSKTGEIFMSIAYGRIGLIEILKVMNFNLDT